MKTNVSDEYAFREVFCHSFCKKDDKLECRYCILNKVNYYRMPLRDIMIEGRWKSERLNKQTGCD